MKSSFLETLDVVLWIASGAVVGIIVGLYLHAPVRQSLFLAVLIAGVVALVRLYRPKITAKPIPRSPGQSPELARVAPGDLDSLLRSPEPLSSAESRTWLDAFLKKQQSKSQ